MTDIFLRPVTETNVIRLYDPTKADAVVEPGFVQGGGGGHRRYGEYVPKRRESFVNDDEDILTFVMAFVRVA